METTRTSDTYKRLMRMGLARKTVGAVERGKRMASAPDAGEKGSNPERSPLPGRSAGKLKLVWSMPIGGRATKARRPMLMVVK